MDKIKANTNPLKEPKLLLGDHEIRSHLIRRLQKASHTPRAILEELRVCNGNAIADVVAVHQFAHCYEIKSDRDSLERAHKQASYYDLVFTKVTLVTTKRHIDKALMLIPSHWGVMVAQATKTQGVTFAHVRSARFNGHFNKQLALLTLWRSEMSAIAESTPNKSLRKMNREDLSILLSERFSSENLARQIGTQLAQRHLKDEVS